MGKIENPLIVGVTVDRAHESVGHTELVVHHLGQRCEAIGRATRIGNDRVFGRIVNVIIDADANRGVGIFGRRGNEHPFCAAFADVQLSLIAAGEEPGRFQNNIDIQLFPREISRVALLEDPDLGRARCFSSS
jgi:hypothetical protein